MTKRNESEIKHSKSNISAAEACPDIYDWWDFSKNDNIDPSNLSYGIKTKFYFTCPECHTDMYREMGRFIIKNKVGTFSHVTCQKCHPTQSKIKVNLVDAVPDIEKYWDYEANEGKKPSDFGASSSEKVWTKCPICGTSVRRNVRFSWTKDDRGVGHVLHCRTCGKRNKNNSLVELFPDIKKYWIYDKNKHNPEYYAISSGKKVYIRCPNCGEERYGAICDFIVKENDEYRITACKKCGLLKPTKKDFISIVEACPSVDEYWDESNDCKPENISITDKNTKIRLKCPSCGKIVERVVYYSFKKNEKTGLYEVCQCHHCATKESGLKRGMQQSGLLIDECSEFKEWWNFDKNTIDIKTITRGTHTKVHLKCPACGKELYRDPHKFVAVNKEGRLLPVACPECGYSSKGDPENNILKLCPSVSEWWDYQANYPFRPEQFTQGSQFKAYFVCPDCGLKMYAGIHSLLATDENGKLYIRHEGKCRKYKAMESNNNLVKKYPLVKEWWDCEANNGESPEEYTIFSPKKVHFICPDCGGKFYMRISDAFDLLDNGTPRLFRCPYCNDMKALPGFNSLLDLKPNVAAEWSPNNDMKADEVLPKSYNRALWICPTCGGEYSALIRDREVGDNACPYCKNIRPLAGYNTLADVKPELVSEWSPNNEDKPNEVIAASSLSALWICPTCGGEYSAAIRDRELNDDSCPYCKNKKVLPGYNTVLARHPKLIKEEWCYAENILLGVNPDNILESYQGKVWWKCSTCGTKYLMTVKDRLMKKKRGHVACQQCRGRRWRRSFNI